MSWRELIREELKGLEPYRVTAAETPIRLDANESPLELPEEVRRELSDALAALPLNRYPDILATELRGQIAQALGVLPQQILIGNGSDEILGLITAVFARPRKNQTKVRVCYPTPSFVMYRVATAAAGAMPLEVPLRPDFTIDEVAVERALVAGQPNILFLARPNNPTGTLWPRAFVEKLLKGHPGLLLVLDEAYEIFAGEHGLDLLPRHENLIILRTLSKLGLAGLRVGMLIAHPELVHEVEKIRPPYNVGVLPQRAAALLLGRHRALLEAGAREVVSERTRVSDALAQTGTVVFPSHANFVMVRVPEATKVWEALTTRGILVKNFDPKGGLLAGCLRITIGTRAENDALLAAMAEVVPRLAPPAEVEAAVESPEAVAEREA